MTTIELGRATARTGLRRAFRQTMAVADMEIRRLLGRSGLPLALLAGSPLAIFIPWALLGSGPAAELAASGEHAVVFAGLFHGFLLRLILFFGCVAIFSNAFRREILDQTLHYALLVPIRREALVLGKYIAGVAWGAVAFGIMVGVSLTLFYAPMGAQLLTLQTVSDGLTYVAVAVMAVIGYGALFLAVGLYVRNPIVPAVITLAWESASFILPPILQKMTVIYYLQQLSPVPVPDSPFAIPAEPTPAYIAVPGLLIVSAALLAVAARKLRCIEINYGPD